MRRITFILLICFIVIFIKFFGCKGGIKNQQVKILKGFDFHNLNRHCRKARERLTSEEGFMHRSRPIEPEAV
jgi:hypothetical protein